MFAQCCNSLYMSRSLAGKSICSSAPQISGSQSQEQFPQGFSATPAASLTALVYQVSLYLYVQSVPSDLKL